MTKLYLAYTSRANQTLKLHAHEEPVDLLVAFPFVRDFMRARSAFNVRSWCLDSGAFSVHTGAAKIDLEEFISFSRDCDAEEVFGLDVIGDEHATRRNLEHMWSAGVAAIPTWHRGGSAAALRWACESSPVRKIALGGVARMPERAKVVWLRNAFAHCWPIKIHGFGASSRAVLDAMPMHSVDASSWTFAPLAMGAWAGLTPSGKQSPLRARGIVDVWPEVLEMQRRSRRAEAMWRTQLAALA